MSAAIFFTECADMMTCTFKGLNVLLQANNLGNEAYRTCADSKDKPHEYIKYGRTILFGVNIQNVKRIECRTQRRWAMAYLSCA
jgi:hypothetical protein